MKNPMKRKGASRFVALLVCCCMLLSTVSTGISAAYNENEIDLLIEATYQYEKDSGSKVLSDTEAKAALTERTDLLIMAAGRDVENTMVTDDEFSTYLGYVNVNLRNGNGTYKAVDFLRAAVAVCAAGGDPANVNKDSNGNRIDLLYKGVYARSITTLENEGPKTVAYALLALDACGVSDMDMRFAGSKVNRSELKSSLVASANTLSSSAVPDVGTASLVLSALAPYYCDGETSVVSSCNALLYKISGLQSAAGDIKNSSTATAGVISALCAMNIDPADNAFFPNDLIAGLNDYKISGGGYSESNSSSADASATASARCALVAYRCFMQGGFFYDFSMVEKHSVKNITTTTTGTGSSSNNTNNNSSNNNSSSGTTNNSSSSNKNNSTGSSSSNKNNTTSSSTNKNTGTSSSSNKNNSTGSSSSAGNNARTITSATDSGKIIEKSVFEALKGKDENHLYEGTWGENEPYTLSFNGQDITNPMDFNAEISNIASHQMEIDAAADEAEYICFLHNGAFPGKAKATITVSVADGEYQCYHYDETRGSFVEVGAVTVSGGMVTFDVETGGDYFITSAEVSTENIEMSAEDTVDGVVPASVFENIMGKNSQLVLSGETDRGVRYEIVFDGATIESPIDFNMQITETTAYWEEISKLAEGPLVIHFDHNGTLPGPAMVNVYANLDSSVTYALFFYNPSEDIGVYSSAIEVGDGTFSFGLTHCSDYFIAEYTGETLLEGGSNIWLILLIVLGALLVIGAVVFLILLRVYGKEGLKKKADAAMAKVKGTFGGKGKKGGEKGKKKKSKKGKKGKKGEAAPAEGEIPAEEAASEEISEEALEEVTFEDAESPADEFAEIPVEQGEYTEVEEIASVEEAVVTESAEDVAERDDTSFMRPDDTLEKE